MITHTLRCATVLTFLLATALIHVAEARVVGVDANGNYWEANPETAVGTMLGSTGISGLGSMAADDAATLYTADASALYTLDFDNGQATHVTDLSLGDDAINIQAMAFGENGILYAANVPATGANSDLWQIDIATGIGSFVASTDHHLSAMDYRQGTMFAYGIGNKTDGPGLGALNLSDGSFVDLDPTVSAVDVHGISFKAPISPGAPQPRCCELFAAGSHLFGMDPVNGDVFDIGQIDGSGVTLVGIEGFFAVPEPSMGILPLVLLFGGLLRTLPARH